MSLEKASPWPFVGMAGMAAAFFLYAASGVLAPWWAVIVLLVVWMAFLVTAFRWWTPYPNRLPWLALAAIVVWFAVMLGGGVLLGWPDA